MNDCKRCIHYSNSRCDLKYHEPCITTPEDTDVKGYVIKDGECDECEDFESTNQLTLF